MKRSKYCFIYCGDKYCDCGAGPRPDRWANLEIYPQEIENKIPQIKKIYLAGPDVFKNNAIEYGNHLKKICEEHGFIGLFPFDNDEPNSTAQMIYDANVSLLNQCDIVIANIDAFHGPSADVGTVFEIGYAVALKKKVVCYLKDNRTLKDKIISLYGPLIDGKTSDGMGFDDFWEVDNLMIVKSVNHITKTFEDAILYCKENYV
jgi:nucleoside deoxyribosyltransferase